MTAHVGPGIYWIRRFASWLANGQNLPITKSVECGSLIDLPRVHLLHLKTITDVCNFVEVVNVKYDINHVQQYFALRRKKDQTEADRSTKRGDWWWHGIRTHAQASKEGTEEPIITSTFCWTLDQDLIISFTTKNCEISHFGGKFKVLWNLLKSSFLFDEILSPLW